MAREYDEEKPYIPTTALSRALVKHRKRCGLTQQQVGDAIRREKWVVNEYETGIERPKPFILAALGKLFGEDLVLAFPLPGTSPKELAVRGNIGGRLQHLVDVTCGGKRGKFAELTGFSASTLSTALNGRRRLTPANTELVFRALPELSRDWLTKGKGEPFGPGGDPAPPPVPAKKSPGSPPTLVKAPPREVVPRKRQDWSHPNQTGTVLREVQEIGVFDQSKLTGDFTFGELDLMPLKVLEKMAGVLADYGNQDCGLTPAQVRELAAFLYKFYYST